MDNLSRMVSITDNSFLPKETMASEENTKSCPMNGPLQMRIMELSIGKGLPKPTINELDNMPALVSDREDLSDDEDCDTSNLGCPDSQECDIVASAAAEKVKRDMKSSTEIENIENQEKLPPEQFQKQKVQVYTIIVKYVADKVNGAFPPQFIKSLKETHELPLEKFLLVLMSRLRLSFPLFLKGVLYLRRYMDIIYLLRYLNQSNNFASYNGMDFDVRMLIVGCFKIALSRERIARDWTSITGISTSELHQVVKTIIHRMNGKLAIKSVEFSKLKKEIFHFVVMVTRTKS